MVRINKRIILDYYIGIFLMLLMNSCGIYNETGSGEYTYNYQFEKYEPYLSIDSVYKTPEEKEKFNELKAHFLKVWLNPYNFKEGDTFRIHYKITDPGKFKDYVEPDNCYYEEGNGFGDYSIRNVYVDNILHTPNYDTLLVLVVTDEAMLDKYGNVILWGQKKTPYERIRGMPMRVLVDDKGNWRFVCQPIRYGVSTSPFSDEELRDLRRSLKRAIIRASYFKKDLKPDPTFWNRLFTDPNIFFPDPYKTGFPLN